MDLFKFSTYTEIQLADILGESICEYSTAKENYLYSQEDRFPVGTEGEATAVAVTKKNWLYSFQICSINLGGKFIF